MLRIKSLFQISRDIRSLNWMEELVLQFLKDNDFKSVVRREFNARGYRQRRFSGREFLKNINITYVLEDRPDLKIGLILDPNKFMFHEGNLQTISLEDFEAFSNFFSKNTSTEFGDSHENWIGNNNHRENEFHTIFIINNDGVISDLTSTIKNKAYVIMGKYVEISNDFNQKFLPKSEDNLRSFGALNKFLQKTIPGIDIKGLSDKIKNEKEQYAISILLSEIYQSDQEIVNYKLKSDLILSFFSLIYFLKKDGDIEVLDIEKIIKSFEKNISLDFDYEHHRDLFVHQYGLNPSAHQKIFELLYLVIEISNDLNDKILAMPIDVDGAKIFNNFYELNNSLDTLSDFDNLDLEKLIYLTCVKDQYYNSKKIDFELDLLFNCNSPNKSLDIKISKNVSIDDPWLNFTNNNILLANSHSYFYLKRISERVMFSEENTYYVYNDSYISRLLHCINDLHNIEIVNYVDELFHLKKDIFPIINLIDFDFTTKPSNYNILSFIDYFKNNQMVLTFFNFDINKTNSLHKIRRKLKDILFTKEVYSVTQFLDRQICMYLNKNFAKREGVFNKILFKYEGESSIKSFEINNNDSLIKKIGFNAKFYQFHNLIKKSNNDIYFSEILETNQVFKSINRLRFDVYADSICTKGELTVRKILDLLRIDSSNYQKKGNRFFYFDINKSLSYNEMCSLFDKHSNVLIELQRKAEEILRDRNMSNEIPSDVRSKIRTRRQELTLYDKGSYIIISNIKRFQNHTFPLGGRVSKNVKYEYNLVKSENPIFVPSQSFVFSVKSNSIISIDNLFEKFSDELVLRQINCINNREFLNKDTALSLLGNVMFNEKKMLEYRYNSSQQEINDTVDQFVLNETSSNIINLLSDQETDFHEKERLLFENGDNEMILFLNKIIENSAKKEVQLYFNRDFHTLKENFKDIFDNYKDILDNHPDKFKDFLEKKHLINIEHDKKWLNVLPKHFDDLGMYFANLYNLKDVSLVHFVNDIRNVLNDNRKKLIENNVDINFNDKLFFNVEVLDSLNGINMSESAYIEIANEFSEAVFHELLTNSIKYAWHNNNSKKRVINISLSIENYLAYDDLNIAEDPHGNLVQVPFPTDINQRKLHIYYSDNGIGIPDPSKLFNCGERFDMDKTSIKGTGYGLCKAQKIIEISEGTIQYVVSENNIHGFHIYLPLKQN